MTISTYTRIETPVSRAHPAVKRLLGQTVLAGGREWKGRRVVVLEVGPGWEHTQHIDDMTTTWHVSLETGAVEHGERPRGFGVPRVLHRPLPGSVLVIKSHFMGEDMGVELVILANADHRGAMDVAQDVIFTSGARDPRAKELLKACGAFGPLLSAVVEGRIADIARREKRASSETPAPG